MDFVSFWRTCERMNFVSFWRNCERMDFVSFWRTCERMRISSVFGVPVNVWFPQFLAYL